MATASRKLRPSKEELIVIVGSCSPHTRHQNEVKKLQDKLDDEIVILVCTYVKLETRELVKLDGITLTTLKDFRQKLENISTANMII